MARSPKQIKPKKVAAITHRAVSRRNAPTAELQSIAERVEEMAPTPPIRFERSTPLKAGTERARDKDLDPQIVWNGAKIKLTKEQVKRLAETGEIEIGDAQLVWRGKDRQDWSDLVVNAPPVYIQEKIHPKALIDECVQEWSQGANDNMRVLVNHAFQTDKEGKINTGRVLALRRLAIQDEKWQQAMQAIADSMQTASTKPYIRFYERMDATGEYRPISLDVAGV